MKLKLISTILALFIVIGVGQSSGLVKLDEEKSQCEIKMCLEFIKQIESAGDSLAFNHTDGGSRGLYQISPSCLKEYNRVTHHKYTLDDLFKVKVNTQIAVWMIDVEIPMLLKHYKIEDTLENQIICYNAGIDFLVSKRTIPTTTKEYIVKYKKLLKNS